MGFLILLRDFSMPKLQG